MQKPKQNSPVPAVTLSPRRARRITISVSPRASIFTIFFALTVTAAPAKAQATFESLIPKDFDLSGIWVLDPRPSPGSEAVFDRCDHELGAKQNFPMYGRAWMELRTTAARYEFIAFD